MAWTVATRSLNPSLLATTLFVGVVALVQPSIHLDAQEPKESLGALLSGAGFAKVPPGEFVMGSGTGTAMERPVHRVRISKDFEMGRFEVTQAQWEAVMATAHPSTEPDKGEKAPPTAVNPSHFRGPTLPVESVSWNTVQQFLTKLNARDTKYAYRLPTEAEWEYADRAGRTDDAPGNMAEIGWFEPNSGGQTHPIGLKRANAWGLYDTQGNVAEWVSDWFAPDYYEESPAADPPGPSTGSYRIYRGCDWFTSTADCRAAARRYNFPSDGYYNVGFRLVRTPR